MRKMRASDIEAIAQLLKTWKHPPLTWERVESQISTKILDGERSWSRQSLQKNHSIRQEWDKAYTRFAGRKGRLHPAKPEGPSEVEVLTEQLTKLQSRYEALLMRHRRLVYNASMLPGGARLLLDPLPDNTPAQKQGIGKGRPKNN